MLGFGREKGQRGNGEVMRGLQCSHYIVLEIDGRKSRGSRTSTLGAVHSNGIEAAY